MKVASNRSGFTGLIFSLSFKVWMPFLLRLGMYNPFSLVPSSAVKASQSPVCRMSSRRSRRLSDFCIDTHPRRVSQTTQNAPQTPHPPSALHHGPGDTPPGDTLGHQHLQFGIKGRTRRLFRTRRVLRQGRQRETVLFVGEDAGAAEKWDALSA